MVYQQPILVQSLSFCWEQAHQVLFSINTLLIQVVFRRLPVSRTQKENVKSVPLQ